MDADDISFPTRIEEQVLFMESNPKVVALGTWARMIGNGKVRTLRKAREHAEIERLFLFVSPIIHPSSIIRKDVLKKYNIKYREEYEVSQDLQLWYELMKIGELANLQKCLLEYRLENNNSVNQKEKVKKYSNQIRRSFITDFLENYKVMQIDIPLNVELDSIKFFKKKISAYIRKTEKNDPVFSLFIKNIIFWFYVSLENFKIKTVLYFVFSLDILKSPHISVLKKLFSGYLNTLIHKVK